MAAQKSSPYNALFYILQQQQFQKTAKHFVFSHFITTFARKYNDYSMVKKYDIPNDEPQMVSESMGAGYGAISATEALWALIINQAKDVQFALKERLDRLFTSEAPIVPYTMEELQARIEESTTQMENGDVVSGEDVYKSMRSFVNSLS